MPAHPDAFEVLTRRLRRTQDPELIDALLDIWNDYKQRATEWDADQWGFDADWMSELRDEINRRALNAPLYHRHTSDDH